MLGKLTRKEKADGCLDFAGSKSLGVVVRSELGGLGSNSLEKIGDERVHDAHGLGRDTGVRMDLLQDLVNVDGVRFGSLLLPCRLFNASGHAFLGDLLLRDGDALSFGCHC